MKVFGKGLVVAGALIGASLTGIDVASAMPIATDGVAAPPVAVEKVVWPCGPAWHPNPWGRCVPNWGYGYGVYGRPYYRRWGGPGWGYRRWGYGHYRRW